MRLKSKNAQILFDIFKMGFVVAVILRFVLDRKNLHDAADTVTWIIAGLITAALITWLIDRFAPSWFGNRPSREELDKLNNE
jgi:hypothetical protein